MPTRDDPTIADLETAGFTHLRAECGHCTKITLLPFELLRRQGRANATTHLASIVARLRCDRCGMPPAHWRSWNSASEPGPGVIVRPSEHR